MLYFLLFFSLLCYDTTAANDPIDLQFYHIDLDVSIDKKYIKGTVLCRFTANAEQVSTIQLDLHSDLKVSKIEHAASFEQKNNQLRIELDKQLAQNEVHTLKIYYEGVPPSIQNKEGINMGLLYSKHGKGEHPVIATICHPQGAYLWFPCKESLQDKSDSIYIDIGIDDRTVQQVFIDKKTKEESIKEMPLIAVSNGVLEGIKKQGNIKKYLWRHRYPIAPQHVLVAVSNFMKAESTFKGQGYSFPLNFYILPENLKKSKSMMRRIPEIMACLTNTFGPYPYRDEGFNVTQIGIPLGLDGMPTQSNVLLEDMKATNMYKIVHEMASMWFGNYISPQQWQDAWITEALAAYAEGMWQEYKRGLTVYQIILDEKEYFDGGKLYLDNKADYSKERLNKKGMYAIHMLRGIMTDAYFFQTLKAIISGKRLKKGENKYLLSTKRFQRICEYYASENIDRDYGYFFEQWVKGEYFPQFNVSYTQKNNELQLTVEQTQRSTAPNFFSMPIPLHLVLQDGTLQKETLNYNKATQTFTIATKQPVTSVLFDPDNWILKDLLYVKKIDNDKFDVEQLKFVSSKNRRQFDISFDVAKKQDIQIQIIRIADAMTVKVDKTIIDETIKKASGNQNKTYELPLALDSRGSYKIIVSTKGTRYTKYIRLKRIKTIF